MLSTTDSSATSRVVLTHKRHIWLLHLVARGILRSVPGAACCFSPGIAFLGWEYTADLVPPARWWRREAARGLAELEMALDD